MKKKYSSIIIATLLAFGYIRNSSAETLTKPNIVLIIGDDIGWNDIGCYGNNQVYTPNIDKLANEGIRFTNAFLTTSSSSPSRASIISGRYPHNTAAAELHTSMPAEIPIFPELLRKAGYYTAQAGKWHLGDHSYRAFDKIHDQGKKENGDGGEEMWVNVLRERPKNKPFFVWFASFDAHRTWGPNQFSGTNHPDSIPLPPYLVDEDGTRLDMAKYYDEISRFDHYIGEVERELEKQGVLDNTIIIIMSDNGRPFPRAKTWVYDDGMKTPLVVKWPNGIKKEGSVCTSLVSSIDLAPTIMDVCGVKIPDSFQGVSIRKLLRDPTRPFRNYLFAEQNWHDYETHERMVHTKDFLYIVNHRPALSHGSNGGLHNVPSFDALLKARDEGILTDVQKNVLAAPRPKEELYDCRNDSLQLNNLANNPDYAKEIALLRKKFKQWQAETGDNVPEHLTPDWYERETGIPLEAGRRRIRGEMPGAALRADTICSKGPF